MIYSVPDLIREVKIALDLDVTNEALLTEEDTDALTLENVIANHLPLAARCVILSAPRHLLDHGEMFGDTIGWAEQVGIGKGIITLPEDFLRLVTFKMSDWAVPCHDMISESDERYLLQTSPVKGLRGNPERPVVALVHRSTGLTLEFYSCEAGENVKLTQARYIPVPVIREQTIRLCEKLKDATVFYAAYLTALSSTSGEQAAALKNQAEQLMS